jgi:hypothetical protein
VATACMANDSCALAKNGITNSQARVIGSGRAAHVGEIFYGLPGVGTSPAGPARSVRRTRRRVDGARREPVEVDGGRPRWPRSRTRPADDEALGNHASSDARTRIGSSTLTSRTRRTHFAREGCRRRPSRKAFARTQTPSRARRARDGSSISRFAGKRRHLARQRVSRARDCISHHARDVSRGTKGAGRKARSSGKPLRASSPCKRPRPPGTTDGSGGSGPGTTGRSG